jgi:hypothetical protein
MGVVGVTGPTGLVGDDGATGPTGLIANYTSNETATGAIFNGKPVYRRTFFQNVTAVAGGGSSANLHATPNYYDTLVNVGGSFEVGNLLEKMMINTEYMTPSRNYLTVYIGGTGSLGYSTSSSYARTNAPAWIWVDYTKI